MTGSPNLYHKENEGWKKNPGFNPFKRNPDVECFYKYNTGWTGKWPDKARNREWKIRGWDFDIAYYWPLGAVE